VKSVFSGAAALLLAALTTPARPETPSSTACEIHFFPAEGPHSVGEDFDAVKRVDQDLRHYDDMAGRPLNWLTPARQLEVLDGVAVGVALGITEQSKVPHKEPISRREAVAPEPRAETPGCHVEVRLPQIMLERGGLATRSVRIFGVVRRYDNGQQVASFSGYSAAPMTGFQLRSPEDAERATKIVETAYRGAVEQLLQNSRKTDRK
jgi:hypothetical protein